LSTKDELKDVRRVALALLARRDHSETEMCRKLQKKGFADDAIRHVLDEFIREKWLNNARFIEHYVAHRRGKGFGPLRIRGELLERGLSKELIDPCLKITDNAWLADVSEVFRKRFKNRMPHDLKTRAAQMRFLYSRGFTSEQIESVFT